jgi:tRNA threonylcarbamoyladenosine biosynthesis protein TsaB
MKILALETSAAEAAFAAVELDENQKIISAASRVINQSRQVSRDAVLCVAGALGDAGWTLDDIDAIAVGIGPGSWTGLRIGMTTAKTIAQTRELPLVGVPTLDALAHAGRSAQICDYCFYFTVAPCRPGEVYVKSWLTRDSNFEVRYEERIATPQQIADEIAHAMPPWLAFAATPGAGTRAIQEVTSKLSGFGTEIIEVAPEKLAQSMAILAAQRLARGERDDPLAMQPLYLAPSNAERTLAEKIARGQAAQATP